MDVLSGVDFDTTGFHMLHAFWARTQVAPGHVASRGRVLEHMFTNLGRVKIVGCCAGCG